MDQIRIEISQVENGWHVTVHYSVLTLGQCSESLGTALRHVGGERKYSPPRSAVFKKASEAAEWINELVEDLG